MYDTKEIVLCSFATGWLLPRYISTSKNSKMTPGVDIELINQQVRADSEITERIFEATAPIIVGQRRMMEALMIGLLTKGHILLEGLPGLAKTLAIRTLAAAVDGDFSRIQFTPDLLPADIVGTMIYNPGKADFSVRKGPVFANFVLADEINRAPAKVQSALLEAMQELQVTIGGDTYKLEEPFLVLATQNPVEQEGTYPLPEAQTDRFMLKVVVDYPAREDERQILRRNLSGQAVPPAKSVVSLDEIHRLRKSVANVYIDEKIESYILDLVFATRRPGDYKLADVAPLVSFGASPRASINLARAAKAQAFLQRRGYVVPEDVRSIAKEVLRHRIGLTYEAEAESVSSDEIVNRIIDRVEVP